MYHLSTDVNTFEKIITFIGKTAERPKPFGVFHIVSVGIILAISFFVITQRHRITEKILAYSMLTSGVIMVVLEIYKQVVTSYDPETDTWAYPWHFFPFQFCSTPIYLTLIAFFLYKIGKTEHFRAVTAFLGTYSLIGAVVVFSVGMESVFASIIGINIQTTIHHGLMFILAVAILSSGKVSFTLKTAVNTYKIFCVLVVTALVLNSTLGRGKHFDMFYLASDSQFVYPIFNDLFGGKLPHFVYVIGYMVLFTLGASLILWIGRLIKVKKEKKS